MSLPGEDTPICASRHEEGAILAKDHHLHTISMTLQLIHLMDGVHTMVTWQPTVSCSCEDDLLGQ